MQRTGALKLVRIEPLERDTHPSAGEQGSYALEMALMMPLYLMLVFGFISTALLLFVYCEATYAVRAAVRYASVHSAATAAPCQAADIADSATGPTSGIIVQYLSGVNGGQITVPARGCTGKNAVGSSITITVQVYYPVGLPYIGASGITLTSTASGYVLK